MYLSCGLRNLPHACKSRITVHGLSTESGNGRIPSSTISSRIKSEQNSICSEEERATITSERCGRLSEGPPGRLPWSLVAGQFNHINDRKIGLDCQLSIAWRKLQKPSTSLTCHSLESGNPGIDGPSTTIILLMRFSWQSTLPVAIFSTAGIESPYLMGCRERVAAKARYVRRSGTRHGTMIQVLR